MNEHINNIYTETCLDIMTEYGIKRWEKILNIISPTYWSLEDRRFAVKSMLSSAVPYTDYNIRRMLDNLIGSDGYVMTLYLEEGDQILHLELRIANKHLYNIIYDMLDKTVSAELFIVLNINWNRWSDLLPFTWSSLTDKTWIQAKEEEY